MTAYQFSQPWLSKLNGDMEPTAREFASLRRYLQGLDDGSVSLFNLKLLNATINSLTAGGNIAMGGFKLTGLGAGSTNGDSLRYEQVIGLYLLLTGGTMSGNIAMGSNKLTGLANGSSSTDSAAFGQIKLIQTITATSATATSTTSATFQAATNQSVSITPTSSSNRILVNVSTMGIPGASNGIYVTLKRGTTELSNQTDGFSAARSVSDNGFFPIAFHFVDSPATTSSTTYQVFFRSLDGATSVTCGRASMLSCITAQEIV